MARTVRMVESTTARPALDAAFKAFGRTARPVLDAPRHTCLPLRLAIVLLACLLLIIARYAQVAPAIPIMLHSQRLRIMRIFGSPPLLIGLPSTALFM